MTGTRVGIERKDNCANSPVVLTIFGKFQGESAGETTNQHNNFEIVVTDDNVI